MIRMPGKASTTSDIVKFFFLVIVLIIALIFAYVTTAETLDIRQKQQVYGNKYENDIIKAAPFIEKQVNVIGIELGKPEQEAENAIAYVNQVRKRFLVPEIGFDMRVYALAKARATDMAENNYFGHTSPEGKCADNMKSAFDINSYEYAAENIYFGNTENMTKVIDAWMQSKWHRFNLLFEGHKAGAIACENNICVFLGLNQDEYGRGCYISFCCSETIKSKTKCF